MRSSNKRLGGRMKKSIKRTLAYVLCGLLSLVTPDSWALATGDDSSSYTGQGAPLNSQEIDSLVSPIALYPDALVAQILGAATFPDQIAVADNWVQQNKSLAGNALAQAVD